MEKRVYECPTALKGKFENLLKADPYAETSFSRQGYTLKEGKTVGGDADKYYLVLNADEKFFAWAEEKLKTLEQAKRSAKEVEQKIIAAVEAEEGSAEQGLGAIFG